MGIELTISREPYRIDSKKEKKKKKYIYIYILCVWLLGVFCVQFEIGKIGKQVLSH